MKIKRGYRAICFFLIIISATFVSSINLDVKTEAVSDTVISELETPALFTLKITNNGESDIFELYTLVSVDISPKNKFSLSKGETKEINVSVIPSKTIRKNSGEFPFIYKIKGAKTTPQEERLTVRIVKIKDALLVTSQSITPDSKSVLINVENLENFHFLDIDAGFKSVFFSFDKNFSLMPFEKKSFDYEINKENTKNLMAGTYILSVILRIEEAEENFESSIRFLEKSGISTEEVKEGMLIRRTEIEKRNDGNLPAIAEITLRKSLFSRPFTTLAIEPLKTETEGLTSVYYWAKEVRPGESLKVVVTTNWIILIVLVLSIIFLSVLANIYLKSDLVLTKKIQQVKTKGGEFALKVSINAKARKYIEKINLVDKLPNIVKLYPRYGTITPDHVDEKNRRLEWNLESMNQGEDRILSYIIYSKIGVVGRFELPPAKAIYEKKARIKETRSNKVFFVSEPGKLKEE